METWVIILIIVGVIALFIIFLYNRLITMRARVRNAWSQIDVQLKRRYDLIPNLVKTVKGYAKHEKELFTEVTKARASMGKANSVAEKAKASDALTGALSKLMVVAENYPTLKANENFMQLQEELSGTENKIAYSRQFYNDSVMAFNIAIQKFPNNIFANMLSFKQEELFKTEGKEREPVKVDFDA